MQKRLVTLLFSVLSIVLSIGLFLVGVIAASSVSTSVTGTFSFNVSEDDFFVEIIGSVSGQASPAKVDNYYVDSLFAPGASFVPWQLPELAFDYNSNGAVDIVFTFNVKNYNEKPIKIEITEIIEDKSKVKNTPSEPVIIAGATFDESNQPVYSTGMLTVTLSALNDAISFKVVNSFVLSLSFA